LQIAEFYEFSNEKEKAREYYLRAVEADPTNKLAAFRYAQSLNKLGIEDAKKIFEWLHS
jgi:tetratricopeptide (TPR) repeat protein